MFVAVKLTRKLPAIVVFAIAAALEIAPIHTGWVMIDEFASRFVYFFVGYWLATYIFALARGVQQQPELAVTGLAGWALVNGFLVFSGYGDLPFVSLALGFAGAVAVVTIAALIAQINWLSILRYAGENSIVVYLAFFLPMAATRAVLLKTGIVPDLGTVALIVTATGVVLPLVFHALTRGTKLDFLFVRPAMFRLRATRKAPLQPAE